MRNADKSEEIVFVCRSGARSGQATLLSKQMGFKFSSNMTGGMIRWNELGYAVERK
ncbi:MAG: rhodanese-like domain-containing protein [Bdellovibrionales bacterium]|nr:rhodanese-like domain-containing protein [Bdellovibrionales bacterium]